MGIRWDDSMATGVESIDEQHRYLISRLDSLLSAMAAGRGREEVEPILAALRDYAAKHFTHEEDCMRRYACPVAAQNITAHRHFVTTFGEIEREYRTSGASSSLTIRVQRELADWIAKHIKGTDTNLRGCVRAA